MDAPAQVLDSPLVLPGAPRERVVVVSPPPRVETVPAPAVEDLPRALLRLAQALGGMGIFGFAMRTAAEHATPGLGHLVWALAFPGALALAWIVCLPALYVFWAARQEGLGAKECLAAALEGVASTGAALASTAPILWFFAVTAPHSRILSPLCLLFAALALVAGGAIFGSRLRELGGRLRAVPQWAFAALVAVSFVQFAHLTGIHWF